MAKKEHPLNVNNNVNNNNIKVEVNVPSHTENSSKKKPEPNWYVRTILGGIIALILSIGGYYIKRNLDGKSKDDGKSQQDVRPIETTKQNQ